MNKIKKSNQSIGELVDNFSTLMKYKLGVSKPPKKKKSTALISALSGLVLAAAGGIYLLSGDRGKHNRKVVARTFDDISKKTADFTASEIKRLNLLTKQQLEKVKEHTN